MSSLSFAQIPKGTWLSENLVPDDGGYGKFYRGWLIVGESSLDQIITLGMHYDKTKLQILSDKAGILEVFDPNEKQKMKLTYQEVNNSLQVCTEGTNCLTYQRSTEKPPTDPAPHSYPRIRLSARWCVSQDCIVIRYSDWQSEMMYNLNSDFKSAHWRYAGPTEFISKYNLNLSANSYSYRFNNDTSQLSSFMTSIYVVNEENSIIENLARSGVVNLKEGMLTQMQGQKDSLHVQVQFFIEPLRRN
ncbi:hypothetical protein [Bdellovibrio sp. HCB2-146]|uniref:hypothetical protein n=1 Tax=Bdellovibrio sp. HCB2-146 TaxID=3394362 RepID=UPI0039BC60FF